MSARSLALRIEALERDTRAAAPACCWINDGESLEQAAARRFPNGPPPRAHLLFFRWQSSNGAQA